VRVSLGGFPIDSSAKLTLGGINIDADGPEEMLTAWNDLPEFYNCHSSHIFQFVSGRRATQRDACVVGESASVMKGGGDFKDIYAEIYSSSSHLYRRKGK
jgi:hypothetical protein